MVTLLILSAILLFTGKGIADITSDKTNWEKSIFSKYKIDGFFGCKDFTYKRKYRKNKILNYLFSTILVWTTDIWHFANSITRMGNYLSVIFAFFLVQETNIFIIMLYYISTNIIGFHIMYHYILRKKFYSIFKINK